MLEDKAKDLGRTIGQSAEYKAVKRSSDALQGDREASTVLRQMEQIRNEAQAMMDRGAEPTAEMEQALDALLHQVQGNEAYQSAIAAPENFDKLMLRVNQWIADGIRDREDRRDDVQTLFRDTLARFDAPVTVVQGTWEQRLATAAALIDSFTDTHRHG